MSTSAGECDVLQLLPPYIRDMPTRTRLHLAGPSLAFVTTTVADWIHVFDDRRLADVAVDQFRQALAHYRASCKAYVLMPSHLHAVVGLEEYALIAKFMQGFKILSAKRIKRMSGAELLERLSVNGNFRFWQPRYDELVITSELQFRTKIEYIHTNPVRAGLVLEPSQWGYSSAGDWLGKGPGLVPIDREFSFLR